MLRFHFFARRTVRRNGRHDHDHAVARKQFAHKTDAADIGVAILAAEAQALRKIRTHDVAVQQFHLRAAASRNRAISSSEIVLLPAPDIPVSHSVKPLCFMRPRLQTKHAQLSQ
jgi:hypothetical protein